jgi:hypothetical protein
VRTEDLAELGHDGVASMIVSPLHGVAIRVSR